MAGAGTYIGLSLLAAFTGAVFYMVRKPTEDGPSDYAEPFGHIPARVYLPSPRTLDRGGSPLSAAPVTSGPEIEDDGDITVFCNGHWEWGSTIKHNRSMRDD